MNWKEIIRAEIHKPYYQSLTEYLVEDGKSHVIYPDSKLVFNALKLCPMEDVKVVILGQDPYHGPNQAHGLSFSVPATQPIPPSLKNIFKEIKSDLNVTEEFTHGNLESWAKQGVLLLNSVLTVRAQQAGSHQKKGWETFTDEIIRAIDKTSRPKVFIFWGSFAKKFCSLIQPTWYWRRLIHLRYQLTTDSLDANIFPKQILFWFKTTCNLLIGLAI